MVRQKKKKSKSHVIFILQFVLSQPGAVGKLLKDALNRKETIRRHLTCSFFPLSPVTRGEGHTQTLPRKPGGEGARRGDILGVESEQKLPWTLITSVSTTASNISGLDCCSDFPASAGYEHVCPANSTRCCFHILSKKTMSLFFVRLIFAFRLVSHYLLRIQVCTI